MGKAREVTTSTVFCGWCHLQRYPSHVVLCTLYQLAQGLYTQFKENCQRWTSPGRTCLMAVETCGSESRQEAKEQSELRSTFPSGTCSPLTLEPSEYESTLLSSLSLLCL